MGVAGPDRRCCRLDDRGIPEPRIEISGGEGGRNRVTHAGTKAWLAGTAEQPVILRPQSPSRIHRRRSDVRVDVDAAGQDHQVLRVNDLRRPVTFLDDLAVFDAEVFDHPVESIEGIVDAPPFDPNRLRHRRLPAGAPPTTLPILLLL